MTDQNLSIENLANLIALRLAAEADELRASFQCSGNIRYCIVDNLFPKHIAEALYQQYTRDPLDIMGYKSTLREQKYSTNQLHNIPEPLHNAVLAFEQPEVHALIKRITAFDTLKLDADMYAGGISEMHHGHFVLPHLDNSHDFKRENYRAVNALLYLGKNWSSDAGGNLELWPDGLANDKIEVVSRFNRLAIMETPPHSWHAVNPVTVNEPRRCIFYTYFRPEPLAEDDYFQVTSMRSTPGQPLLDSILSIDVKMRMFLRHLFPNGVKGDRVIWKRDDENQN